jgi:hypothetical protein
MASHLAGGKPGPVAKACTAARDVLRDPREVPVTSPAPGAGSAPGLPDCAAIGRSAQSETGRAASPGTGVGAALPVSGGSFIYCHTYAAEAGGRSSE